MPKATAVFDADDSRLSSALARINGKMLALQSRIAKFAGAFLAIRAAAGVVTAGFDHFKQALGKVSYHIPCHGRVQKIGRKTEEMFKLIGQSVRLELNTVERCSGHAGTYGVKTPYHPVAMKIGRPVFKAMATDGPDYISSDCALAGHHIAQGMAQAALDGTRVVNLSFGLGAESTCAGRAHPAYRIMATSAADQLAQATLVFREQSSE